MAFDPERWHDFYVMTGGAAAALTGLLFVAMSLHAREIMANRFFSNRAVGTLMSLASQLLISGAVLIPGQPLTVLGVEVEVAALFFLGFIIQQMATRGPEAPSVATTLTHRLMEMGGGTLWIVLFNAAGISLLLQVGGGLYLLAVVMFFMFAWNIYLAWVLITEVSESG
jgi:modulator of FtsH protease